MANRVQFKPDAKSESGIHSNAGGSTPAYVLLDGVRVGVVRKRSEWYGNLGHRGVNYHYFDFFRLDENDKAVHEVSEIVMRDGTTREERKPFASGTKRKEVVAEALAKLGHYDAARELDEHFADHGRRKAAES
jgi:hypothetical protein